jgi:hypothetical protein
MAGVHLQRIYEADGEIAKIMSFVVGSKSCGGSVGRALISAVEDWARGRGATEIILTPHERRAGAHEFYRRVGYDRTGYRSPREALTRQPRAPRWYRLRRVREDRTQVLQALVGSPQVVSRPVLTQRVQVREFRVVGKAPYASREGHSTRIMTLRGSASPASASSSRPSATTCPPCPATASTERREERR